MLQMIGMLANSFIEQFKIDDEMFNECLDQHSTANGKASGWNDTTEHTKSGQYDDYKTQ